MGKHVKLMPKLKNFKTLQVLHPHNVESATDMAADWQLVGVGVGGKFQNRELLCTLCACPSSQVHQSNGDFCQ